MMDNNYRGQLMAIVVMEPVLKPINARVKQLLAQLIPHVYNQ